MRRVSPLVFIAGALALAIVLGVLAGSLFARQTILATKRRPAVAPGDFSVAEGRPPGVPSTPVPLPSNAAKLAIGFLDEKTNVAIARPEVRAKVGDCVVARVQPSHGSPYAHLIGGERWSVAGKPRMQIRPGDAPGYCLTWSKPSGKKGFAVDAEAVVANDAGDRALAQGGARVIVLGTPKPERGASSQILKHGPAKPQPQATPDDQ